MELVNYMPIHYPLSSFLCYSSLKHKLHSRALKSATENVTTKRYNSIIKSLHSGKEYDSKTKTFTYLKGK